MPDENNKQDEQNEETAAKPTITIAERDGTEEEGAENETAAKPTITIAERDGGQ